MGQQEKVTIRNELIDRLSMELVGPNFEDEEINESPSQRYLTGILWPNGTLMEKEDDEKSEVDDNEDGSATPETIAPLMQAMKPSSIGLSFVIEALEDRISVDYEWGEYFSLGNQKKNVWKRVPVKGQAWIELSSEDIQRKPKTLKTDERGDVNLEWLARPLKDGSGRIAVSLFLVNRREKPEKIKDASCVYQPQLRITGNKCKYPFSVRKLNLERDYQASDVAADNLLYRKQKVFAVGHGVAVDWCEFSGDNDLAGNLFTRIMPVFEIPKVVPPDWVGGGTLDMGRVSEAENGEEIYCQLSPMLADYESWIEEQEAVYNTIRKDLDFDMANTGAEHLHQCRESLKRMWDGLNLIRREGNNREVFRAFCFANKVMARQRIKSIWARQAVKSKNWKQGTEDIRPPQWRPFQIAFILQSIAGIVDPSHKDRKIADLLWFPTGGGKTEAYLGLSAFVMALRRLRGEQHGKSGGAGVTVLMRYTLRLLTIQQFQRAATLICACEMERLQDPDSWGAEPFRIGLWVGSNNTPNDFEESAKLIADRNLSAGAPTPVQLVSCPWCGAELRAKDYCHYKKTRRILIGCSRPGCDFHRTKNPEGIPAVVTDEEIYRLLPSLLIGTVDKFARLPWVGETQSLVGKVKGKILKWGFVSEGASSITEGFMKEVLEANSINRNSMKSCDLLPPDLVIQDELHLISGPLGTMVGLYETAIDYLCSDTKDDVRISPKVIASTATIRRAKEQIQSLFARDLSIFPSPALDSGNSYFSVEQPLGKSPGRTYLGIFAPGRSVKTALVRVYAALLSSTGAIQKSSEDLDPYQTLVGYFNSLRELGGAVRLIEDDVQSRMNVLSSRGRNQKYQFLARDLKENVPELTSRVDSSQIPALLQRLEQPYHVKSGQVSPVDVVFASNMISVGVDVGRLGLMTVTGQPKTTSEYIQATSRVGREHPGLVITVYNWARPRDVSHYERFGSYHAALYRYVEAISVTPFSSRARDRALAAILVSMVRLSERNLSKREAAKKFRSSGEYNNEIMEFIKQRLKDIGLNREEEVEKDLKSLIDKWEAKTFGAELAYAGGRGEKLLYPLGEKAPASTFSIPNSMRDVESSVGIYLLKE